MPLKTNNHGTPVYPIDPDRLQPEIVDKAAAALRAGGVVVVPTTCLYGLCGDAFNAAAVQKIFDIKNRPKDKPLLVLISNRRMVPQVAAHTAPLATALMDRFWPGQLTLVMQAREGLPAGLCSNTGKVGIRLVAHPVAAAVVRAVGGPITGTSANLSGAGGCASIDDLHRGIMESAEMIVDAGALKGGPGSTVVDVTGTAPLVLREGVVPTADIIKGF